MRKILVLGAGRSSSSLISYLLEEASKNNWTVIVGDVSLASAQQKIAGHPNGKATFFTLDDAVIAHAVVENADVVISLLPADFHPVVGRLCLEMKKHLLTASYVSDEMKRMHNDAVENGLLFLNECGLDPGIDHMSAMQIIDRIKNAGGEILSFESFTGGLIAPETDPENPWRYKFTWNPRNVVMAGQSTAKFLEHGKFKYIPYQQLFRRITPVSVSGHGEFEGYANRDSLKYLETYGLNKVQTMLRGTLRNKGFCEAWNIFVQLGCCDDSYEMEGVEHMTHRSFIEAFLRSQNVLSLEAQLKELAGLETKNEAIHKLKWSGFFSDEKVGLSKGTPAQILEHILNKKWKLHLNDKDQIVMWHRFGYVADGRRRECQACLVASGTDSIYTAMAKTVGLPLAISTKLLLQGKIKATGVQIPTTAEFYNPILEELKALGIELQEKETE